MDRDKGLNLTMYKIQLSGKNIGAISCKVKNESLSRPPT